MDIVVWIVAICVMCQRIFRVLGYEVNSRMCGNRPAEFAYPRIVGGTVSSKGDWPWQVLILQDGQLLCGGVLVAEQYVVTAAHCLADPQEAIQLFTFHLGAHKSDASDSSAVQVKIQSVECHPDYDNHSLAFDVCLLKLQDPATFTDYIQPVCFPETGTSAVMGQTLTVTGWGETLGTGPNEFLNEARVPVVDITLCKRWYREERISIPASHFCAGYRDGKIDSCYGDSGGPLVMKESSEQSHSSAYVLRGITSFGMECAEKERPGVYMSISYVLPWIYETAPELVAINPTASTNEEHSASGIYDTTRTNQVPTSGANALPNSHSSLNCMWFLMFTRQVLSAM